MTPVVSKAEAVAKAVEHARFCGMKGLPTGYMAQLMTYGEYCQLAGCHGPELEKPVYVVSMRGDFEWSCPGSMPCPIELYVVVVDAETGSVTSTSASCHAEESPFPVP
jgi:hypothetical protein